MSVLDLSTVENIIREVATTEIMPRFRKLAAHDIEMKGINDPVTVADKESERHLTLRLQQYMPGSRVVGEESFAKDKAVMEHLDATDPVWVIDPIDGTRNFVSGKPEFAVMIALIQNRQATAAWIHDPNSGDTIMAEKGSGVWLRGKRVDLATKNSSIDTVGLVGSRVKKLIADPTIVPHQADVPKIEIGSCAGFDYARLFSGDATFANAPTSRAGFLLYHQANAWDHAPGTFLYQESGGYSADWSGNTYNLSNPRGGLLHAPNKDSWHKLHAFFEPLMHRAGQKAS